MERASCASFLSELFYKTCSRPSAFLWLLPHHSRSLASMSLEIEEDELMLEDELEGEEEEEEPAQPAKRPRVGCVRCAQVLARCRCILYCNLQHF